MEHSEHAALPQLLTDHFGLSSPLSVGLLRAYTNDVYLVETPVNRYVLKIYGVNWRADAEIRYEIDLLDHLTARGVRVASAIRNVDGEALKHINLDGQRRQAVLFEYAAGEKPQPPFSSEMYYREGMATAALHGAADDFTSNHQRRYLDLDHLIDKPMALVASLEIDASTKRSILGIGKQLHTRIDALVEGGLDWGVCHGDLTYDNFHLTPDGDTVWYDFDSGGPGWRAIDLQGWAAGIPDRVGHQQAFLQGYREIRPISENNIAASPYLFAAQEMWSIQVDLEQRILGMGNEAVSSYCSKAANSLVNWGGTLELG